MLFIRQNEAAEAGRDQKEAVKHIKRLVVSGNPDAAIVLDRLRDAPEMHPFLQEIIFA